MRRTAKYVHDETLKIMDEKFEKLTKDYEFEMGYIRHCMPEEWLKKATTGVVMMTAREISNRKNEYDLKRHILKRDELLEQIFMLRDLRKEMSNI